MTGTPTTSSRPPGTVSTVRGRWQRPALTWTSRVLLVVAVLGGLVPDPVGEVLALCAVVVVAAVPLARVAWLVLRWAQERDRCFALLGAALLGVVAFGAVLAAVGVGA